MIGKKLGGRYEVTGELGRGGMGVVYRAQDPVLAREVALKLAPRSIEGGARERLRREAMIVASMDHPSIVPVHDMAEEDGQLFFVMPVVEGQNLRRWLAETKRPLSQVLEIVVQAARGLAYSHARGVLHRDVKPENIMVSESAGLLRARIMDFGLACTRLDTRLTDTGALIGTLSYLSPEQVADQEVDERSDIYALGAVVYESLVGQPPFVGDAQSLLYRIVYEQPKAPRDLGIAVDPELEGLVMRSLAKIPEQRPQTMTEFADELDEIRLRGGSEMTTILPRPQTQKRSLRPPFVGRDREIAELSARLAAAEEGRCQVVLISGEVGLGKTRLIEEFELLLRARGIRVLHGRFTQTDDHLPLGALCELVQDHFLSRGESGASTDLLDLRDLAPELVRRFPMLADLPGMGLSSAGGQAAPIVDADLPDKAALYELIAKALARIGAGRPLVLVLEDLQEAEQSAEALPYLVRRLAATPTLFIVTWRPLEIERGSGPERALDALRAQANCVNLELELFDRDELAALTGRLARGSDVDRSLVDRLMEVTDGNPLFAVELIRSLVESGVIIRDESSGGRLLSRGAVTSRELPSTLRQAVEKRIDRLPPDLLEVLACAALPGRTFRIEDLEVCLPERNDLEDAVDRLQQKGLVVEPSKGRGRDLAIVNGLLREVAQASLTRRRRRLFHLRLAEGIERADGATPERRAAILLHHYTLAEEPEKAVRYGMIAARQFLAGASPDECLQTLSRVLDFLDDERFDGQPELEAEARLLSAEAHRAAHSIESALAAAERARERFEVSRQPERALEAISFAARCAWDARRVDDAARWVEQGVAFVDQSPGLPREPDILALASTLSNLRGEYRKAAEYRARIKATAEPAVEETRPSGGRLVVGFASLAGHLDPALALTAEEDEIAANVFETLIGTNVRGELEPRLAENWELTDGGRALHIVLRDGIRFHDGMPLTATDVKLSLEHSMQHSFGRAAGALSVAMAKSAPPGLRPPGIFVLSDRELRIDLVDPFPVFPILLTSPATAIARRPEGAANPSGTGPFRIKRSAAKMVILERNLQWWVGRPIGVDELEFRLGLTDDEALSVLDAGTVDVVRHLGGAALQKIVDDPASPMRVLDSPKRNVYFVLFNGSSALASQPLLRLLLSRVLDLDDMVRRTLGRLATPATGIFPPGILGHDPSTRRRREVKPEEARSLIASKISPTPIVLRAAVHPVFQERQKVFLDTILAAWQEAGVKVEIDTGSFTSYLEAAQDAGDRDLIIGRWTADYDDPDNFSHGLFHTEHGSLRSWFGSPEVDDLCGRARAEIRPAERERLYRRVQERVVDSGLFLPLFHDNDVCVCRNVLRGLRLTSTAPYLAYSEVAKLQPRIRPSRRGRSSEVLQIAYGGTIECLDPAVTTRSTALEILGNVFETLTRVGEDARVRAGLADEFGERDGGRIWTFRLDEQARFHDGRKVTSRDVRWSFERILRSDRVKFDLLGSIRGAGDFRHGRIDELPGLRVKDLRELEIELDRPLAVFPILLSSPELSIVPEDSPDAGDPAFRAIGSGPYRISHFESRERVELEANPDWRRYGLPRSARLVFNVGLAPEAIAREYRAGSFALASDMTPQDIAALRSDSGFSPLWHEAPGLSTAFCLLNSRRGPLADRDLRRRLVDLVDLNSWRRNSVPSPMVPARGLVPPELTGFSPLRRPSRSGGGERSGWPGGLVLRVAVAPTADGVLTGMARSLAALLQAEGVELRIEIEDSARAFAALEAGSTDLYFGRWVASYPDADSFAYGLLQSRTGVLRAVLGSDAIDRLVERSRSVLLPMARQSCWMDLEQYLAREALVIPLFHDQVYRFAHPRLKGLRLSFGWPAVSYEELVLT